MSGLVMKMLREALDESREKLASDRAALTQQTNPTPVEPEQTKVASEEGSDWEKVASACDFLAANLHEVVDTRTPREKLAELKALAEKVAAMGDEPQGPHQRTKSPDAPEMTPPADDGVGPGAPGTAAASMAAETPGESLDAGASGEASEPPPMTPSDSEAAREGDTATALETNHKSPPGAGDTAPEKIASAKIEQIEKLAKDGKIDAATAVEMMKEAGLVDLAGKAVAAGKSGLQRVGRATMGPQSRAAVSDKAVAKATEQMGGLRALTSGAGEKAVRKAELMRGAGVVGGGAAAAGAAGVAASRGSKKEAQDPSSPQPSISAGTTPELQTQAEPQLSQGSEAGSATPPGPSDDKRRHVQSVEAAINATKGDLKHQQVKGEMSRYLDQDAMSASSDSVLQTQLDNTSSAGVKIAAARALLEKWANEDPQNKSKLAQVVERVKSANAAMGYPAGDAGGSAPGMTNAGGMSAPMPGSYMPAKMAEGEDPASDAALTAAAAGVTPEELAQALMLLEAGGAEEAMPEEAMVEDPQDVPPEGPAQAEPAVG